jgi:hypothetical protein
MYGRFMVLAMNWATVLLPQPAGPVMSQMWWCVVSGWLDLVVWPFVRDEPLVRFEADGERGRRSEVVGVERAIAGRFSYDNIIEETFGPLYVLWTATNESKNVKARDSSQVDVKEKRWKEQTGVERRLIAFAMYSDEQPEQQENEAINKLTMWRAPVFLYELQESLAVESGRGGRRAASILRRRCTQGRACKEPAPH